MLKENPPLWLANAAPVAEAITRLFHPQVEVVIHDIETDRIAAIWNAWSGRAAGDPSLLSDLGEAQPVNGVWEPYEKRLPDGSRLTSVSALLHDEHGAPRGLLCINFDCSQIDTAIAALQQIAVAAGPRPEALFDRDWREKIGLVVHEECRRKGLRADALNRDQRREIVGALDAQGVFETRQAATHVAAALGVSRATVYQMLKEARSQSET